MVEFFVRLCDDVLLEVLRYGDRYRITKMQRIAAAPLRRPISDHKNAAKMQRLLVPFRSVLHPRSSSITERFQFFKRNETKRNDENRSIVPFRSMVRTGRNGTIWAVPVFKNSEQNDDEKEGTGNQKSREPFSNLPWPWPYLTESLSPVIKEGIKIFHWRGRGQKSSLCPRPTKSECQTKPARLPINSFCMDET